MSLSGGRPRHVSTLHLTNAYHAASGGIRTFYAALLESAPHLRRRVTLVVPAEGDSVHAPNAWSRLYTIRAPRAPVFDRRYRLLLPHRYLVTGSSRLREILRREEPEVVEINDKYSLCYLAGALRRRWWPDVARPTIIGHSAERMDESLSAQVHAGATTQRFARWYMRRIYAPLFDYHLANSAHTGAEIQEALPAWRRDHFGWLPMGVDTRRFRPDVRDERLRLDLLARVQAPADAVLLVATTRLSADKSPMLLVEMLEALATLTRADFRLVVAGDGPLRHVLAQHAHGPLRGRLHLLGHVDDADRLARIVASADLFVHANPREPFGIAPLEAMAAGTPVVLPNAGGVLTYATRDNAWLAVPSGVGLAAQVALASAAPEECRRRAEQARQRVRAFEWPLVTRLWFARYDELHERGLDEWHTRPLARWRHGRHAAARRPLVLPKAR
jgi:alpha-1,6-mannosyltransferase